MSYIEDYQSVVDIIGDEPNVFLNIGVGQRPHCEAVFFKERFPDMVIFGLEPQLPTFIDRYQDYPGTLLPWAVWDAENPMILNSTRDMGNSSLLDGVCGYYVGTRAIIEKQWTPCVTLKTIDSILKYPDRIFIWMDIEGAELRVLQSARSLLSSGRVLWVDLEVSKDLRRDGQPSERLLDDFMLSTGFEKSLSHDDDGNQKNNLYIYCTK